MFPLAHMPLLLVILDTEQQIPHPPYMIPLTLVCLLHLLLQCRYLLMSPTMTGLLRKHHLPCRKEFSCTPARKHHLPLVFFWKKKRVLFFFLKKHVFFWKKKHLKKNKGQNVFFFSKPPVFKVNIHNLSQFVNHTVTLVQNKNNNERISLKWGLCG